MTTREALRRLTDFLVSECKGKIQNSGWINISGVRICDECSRHKRSALYIFVKEGSPLFLNCFRAGCETRGVCNSYILKQLGFNDYEAIKVLNHLNSSKIEVRNKDTRSGDLVIRDTKLTEDQSAYFYKRCGFIPDYNDMSRFNILPNFVNVINETYSLESIGVCPKSESSNIDLSRLKNNVDKIIGYKNSNEGFRFISYYTNNQNKFLIRSIDEEYNYKGQIKLNNTSDNNDIFYFKSDNVTSDDEIDTIVISEGYFDIINIFKYYCIIPNGVYSSTGGFRAFEKTILYLYKKFILSVKRLILFLDSDIENENGVREYDRRALEFMFRNLFNKISKDSFEEIFIVYNRSSKDFGDISEPINPVKIQIKLDDKFKMKEVR